MSSVAGQVHDRFKVFSGSLGADGTLGALAGEVEAWVVRANVAPKSIGVEYLESLGKLILTIGYRDDEPAYRVGVTSVPIGRIAGLDAAELTRLEGAMGEASKKLQHIICHELFVTGTSDVVMVFMTYRPA